MKFHVVLTWVGYTSKRQNKNIDQWEGRKNTFTNN